MILMIIVTFSKYIFPLMLNMFRVKLISLVKNEDYFFVLVEKNNDKVGTSNQSEPKSFFTWWHKQKLLSQKSFQQKTVPPTRETNFHYLRLMKTILISKSQKISFRFGVDNSKN